MHKTGFIVSKDRNLDILLVEDEPDLGLVLSQYLRFKDLQVSWSPSAGMALEEFNRNAFQLVVIDIQLPDMNGFELARQIRKNNPAQAFIFLTALQEKDDRMTGLELGAIDYIGKPFDMEEFILKVKNFLKVRNDVAAETTTAEPIAIGKITFMKERMTLSLSSGQQNKLTVRETEILDLLIRNKNQLVLKKDILLQFWGDTDYFNGKSLEVFISRIRKLLKHEKNIRIDSVYGAGYLFVYEEDGNGNS